jgi:hypothetical protein
MYVFFCVSVITIWSRNNALIFDFCPSLKRKIHLVGTLGDQNPVVLKSVRKTPKKVTEKWEFLRIISFWTKLIFFILL